MSTKQIAYDGSAGNWWWRAKNSLDCQIGQLVTMPEQGRLLSVSIRVAGLNYDDPVYGYQNEPGYVRAAVWDERSGDVLAKSDVAILPSSLGGTQPFVGFDLPDVTVRAGQRIIVGFWRRSDSTSYSTQFDRDMGASGQTMYRQHVFGSSSGPFKFDPSDIISNASINYKLYYETGGRVLVWDGNSWEPTNIKVWDGDSWTKGTVRVWDGSAWAESGE